MYLRPGVRCSAFPRLSLTWCVIRSSRLLQKDVTQVHVQHRSLSDHCSLENTLFMCVMVAFLVVLFGPETEPWLQTLDPDCLRLHLSFSLSISDLEQVSRLLVPHPSQL